MVKKKQSLNQRKKQDQVNKKAIYWVSSVLGAIIVILAIMIYLNNL